jgi:hypothetical protein
MKVKLGVEIVNAEDDGGLSLAINIPNFHPVVLSIEVPVLPPNKNNIDKTKKT